MTHNWCPEIYRSIYIDRVNDNDISVAPCCQAGSKIEAVDTFDFYKSPHLTYLRSEFARGVNPSECSRCWDAEAIGHKSRRQGAIEFYNLPPSDLVELACIDHSATWACNLACIMCGPENSSLWATELNYTQTKLINIGRKFQKSNNFLDRLDFTNIQKIHFNGGEPLLNNDQIKLLEKLKEQDVLKNTFISYNTNGTVIPNNKIIDLWSSAKLVKLFFSIDATELAFEYVRWPGNWESVSNNIIAMKKSLPGNVMFGVNMTVGCYNIFETLNVWQWFSENLQTNREGDKSDFCWQLANNFNIKFLPIVVKNHVIDHLGSIPELSEIVNYIKNTLTINEDNNWTLKLDKIDNKRNTNWRNSLAIGKYYKEINC